MDIYDVRYGDYVIYKGLTYIIYGFENLQGDNIVKTDNGYERRNSILFVKMYNYDTKDFKIEKMEEAKLSDVEPIKITYDNLIKLKFEYRYNSILKADEYDMECENGFIKIRNISNTEGKEYSIHIDNLDHDTITHSDVGTVNELQHIIYDSLNINLIF
jgi:hypothetical protein